MVLFEKNVKGNVMNENTKTMVTIHLNLAREQIQLAKYSTFKSFYIQKAKENIYIAEMYLNNDIYNPKGEFTL